MAIAKRIFRASQQSNGLSAKKLTPNLTFQNKFKVDGTRQEVFSEIKKRTDEENEIISKLKSGSITENEAGQQLLALQDARYKDKSDKIYNRLKSGEITKDEAGQLVAALDDREYENLPSGLKQALTDMPTSDNISELIAQERAVKAKWYASEAKRRAGLNTEKTNSEIQKDSNAEVIPDEGIPVNAETPNPAPTPVNDIFLNTRRDFQMQGADHTVNVNDAIEQMSERLKNSQIGAPTKHKIQSQINKAYDYKVQAQAIHNQKDRDLAKAKTPQEREAIEHKYFLRMQELNKIFDLKDIGQKLGDKLITASQGAPEAMDYIMGYHAPQIALGSMALYGAVSNVFSNKGRVSNSQLYNPY